MRTRTLASACLSILWPVALTCALFAAPFMHVGSLAVAQSPVATTAAATKLKDLRQTSWTDVTIPIHSAIADRVEQVNGKQATYEYQAGSTGTFSIDVVAFRSERTQRLWIGTRQDYYVEARSGMHGV